MLASCGRAASGHIAACPPRMQPAFNSASSSSSTSCQHQTWHGRQPHTLCQAAGSTSPEIDEDEAPVAGKAMRVERLLANLGYASRKDCQTLVKKGRVLGRNGVRLKVGDKVHHGDVTLDGEPLDPPFPMTLIMHKPVGYVVTSPEDKAVSDPTIYDLMPSRYGARRPFLSSIGRLDKDTSGLLLLTDDGQLVHKVKSPKQGIWKVYEACLAKPMTPAEFAAAKKRFASGTLLLPGELTPLLPAALSLKDDVTAVVTIMEGRYHQVRRMFTAVGNEVVALHRVQVGGLTLPAELTRGEYRSLSEAELESVFNGPTTAEVLGLATQPVVPGANPQPATPTASAHPHTEPSISARPASHPQPVITVAATGSPSESGDDTEAESDQQQGSPAATGCDSSDRDAGAVLAERQLEELRERAPAYRQGARRLRRMNAFKRRVASPSG